MRRMLGLMDVLIDGVYIDRLNNNRGLRGSTNQKVWFMTDKLEKFDFIGKTRTNEISITNGEINFIGVPERSVKNLPKKLDAAYVRT